MSDDPDRGVRAADRPAASRWLDAACTAGGWLGAGLFATVAALMVAQATARALGFAVVGGDEITGWLSASAGFVALAYTFRQGALIRMELLLARLDESRRRVAELVALGIGSLWTAYMAFAMVRFVWQNAVFHERSTGLISVPIWPVQAPAALGTVLLFLAFAEQFMRVAQGERPVYVAKAERTLAGEDAHSAGI